VVDTGGAKKHPDLRGNIKAAWNRWAGQAGCAGLDEAGRAGSAQLARALAGAGLEFAWAGAGLWG